ncbi:helix-turn-helix domain-containing protein [Paraburkholderia sp. D15]|uniref:helix-turn-helix domain-containing protein n=1 Tax=Paraburkholderia sp. D15 TaxID=2880218 RepID=UPI0024797AA0|nr:helix-turn-helix transcriptional regulator [Paraburkholderia sp. D15]WGS50835.1 helix-turn-helix domain-containing protein [Paraburkholderia sp. D15]
MDGHPTLATQTALARKAGISQSSIQRVLTAAVHPQLDVIEAIASSFRVTPAQLLMEDLDTGTVGVSRDHTELDGLSETDRDKVASYARFLRHENQVKSGAERLAEEFIRLSDLRELSIDELAQVMRPALREPNDNTLTNHEPKHSETKSAKRRTGN